MENTETKVGDVRPIPDPTELTTRQLRREIDALSQAMYARVDSRAFVIETRLDGMDKAIDLIQAANDRFPSALDAQLNTLKEILVERINSLGSAHDEKFNSIQLQFKERDTRTEQTSKDSKVAVDAALQAAKEAVGEQNKSSALAIAKSETSTTKQIDQLAVLIQTTAKATDDKITDLKDRITRIEGAGEGSKGARNDQHLNSGFVLAIVGVVIAALIGAAGLILSIARIGK